MVVLGNVIKPQGLEPLQFPTKFRAPSREGLNPNLYYRWSKEFLEAGKKRLVGDTTREATSSEVTDLRKENGRLKQVVAEMVLENRLLKKNVTAFDSEAGT